MKYLDKDGLEYYNGKIQTKLNSKQNALTSQTAYSSKGSATKVPQITTNSLGQVTNISEVTITQPTVNNGTLTIQKNGTNVQTFTANQSSNVTANITVPTQTSELTNNSGFITSSSDITGTAKLASGLKPVCAVGSDEANSNGWYKVATSTLSGWGNQNILYYIKGGYSNGFVGLLEMEMRSDNTSISCWKLNWVARHPNMTEGSVVLVVDGMSWTMYINNPSVRYGRVYFTEISNRSIQGDGTYAITYFDKNSTKESTAPTATYTSSDGWTVLRAKQDGDGNVISSTYYKASNPSGYITSSGSITGNSATATTLQTYTFNRNNNANTWFKVATTTITKQASQWQERHAFLFIKGSHNSNYNQNGIIAIDSMGNGSSGIVGSYNAQFMSATKDLDLSNFYIEYKNGNSETDGVVNFWIRANTNGYASWQVKILQNSGWTIASSSPTASSMPSSGYTGKNAVLSGSVAKSIGDKNGDDITTTYYKASNPNGYTSNTGTITGVSINSSSIATSGVADIKTNGTYNASSNKIATMSDIPSLTNYYYSTTGYDSTHKSLPITRQASLYNVPVLDVSTYKIHKDNIPYANSVSNDSTTVPLTSAVYSALSSYATNSDLTTMRDEIYGDVYTQTEVNNLIQPHAITIYNSAEGTASVSTAWGVSKFSLTGTLSKVGSKLSISNGAVLVGNGVNHVKISGNVLIKGASGTVQAQIFIGGTRKAMAYNYTSSTGQYMSCSMAPMIVAVSSGQSIELRVGGSAVATYTMSGGGNTYLTVEVVD